MDRLTCGPHWLLLLGIACTACLGSGGGGDGDACEQGSEGCSCFGNDTCLDGLACRSRLCVDIDGTSADSDVADGSDAGTDADEDEEEDETDPGAGAMTDDGSVDDGEDETDAVTDPDGGQATDTQAPDDSPTDEGSSTDEPDADDDDATSTDVTMTDDGVTDDGVTDVSATDEMTTDVEPTEGSSETDTGQMTDDETESACTEGTGSCAAGDAMSCVDGELTDADCSACALLSCGVGCCSSVWPLVANADPYQKRDDLLTSFSTSSGMATVTASFDGDGEQFAAVGFTFDSPRPVDPAYVQFDASASGTLLAIEVSLDLDDDTGCQFATSSGRLGSELFCWGDWMQTGYGGSAQKILVRIISFSTAQTASLQVNSVSF